MLRTGLARIPDFEGVNGTFLKLAERRPENGKTGSSQLAKDGHFAEVNWIVVDSQ